MANHTEVIDVKVSSDGTLIVARDFDKLSSSVDNAAQSVIKLGTQLRNIFIGGGIVAGVLRYADAWTAAENKIRVFSSSALEATAIHEELFKSAQNTRQALGPMTTLYSRVSQAAEGLNITQKEAIEFTDNVGKMLLIQGVNANESRGAMIQLGQAMGMAKLRAQEFNSINEQVPIIFTTVAKNLYGASGSIKKLRDDMLLGKVTAQQLYQSITKASESLNESVAKTEVTFNQAYTMINNALERQIGLFMKNSGVTKVFANGLVMIAQNMDKIFSVLDALAPALAVAFGAKFLGMMRLATGAMLRFTIATAANPLLAMTGLYLAFRDSVVDAAEQVEYFNKQTGKTEVIEIDIQVKDYAKAALIEFSESLPSFKTLMEKSIVGGLANLEQYVNSFLEFIRQATLKIVYYFDVANLTIEKGFVFLQNSAISSINAIVEAANSVQVFEALKIPTIEYNKKDFDKIFDNLEVDLKRNLENVDNQIDGYNFDLNNLADNNSSVLAKRWSVDLQQYAKNVASLGSTMLRQSSGISSILLTTTSEEWSKLVDQFDTATTATLARLKGQATKYALADALGSGGGVNLGDKKDSPVQLEGDKKGLSQLERQLKGLMNKLDPVNGAILEMKLNTELLTKAVAAGLVTQERANTLNEEMAFIYKNKTAPVTAEIEALYRETQALNAVSIAQKSQWESSETLRKFKEANIKVTDVEIEQLEKLLLLNNQLATYYSAVEGYYKNGEEYGFNEQVNSVLALNKALDDGYITLSQYQNGLANVVIELGKLKINSDELTDTEFFSGAMSNLMSDYTTAMAGLLTSFDTFFEATASGYANTIAAAVVQGDNLIEGLKDISRTILTQLLGSLIKLGVQYGINAMLANTAQQSVALSGAVAGATVAAAWQPAATMVSLGTMGSNASGAMSGIIATDALTKALSVGFSSGGWTGNMGVNEIAGVTHGQEFVMDADSTARIGRHNLEALQSGKTQASDLAMSKSSMMRNETSDIVNKNDVNIVNYVDPSEYATFLKSNAGQDVIINIIKKNKKRLGNDL